ncbi:MAG: hypothetical protein ACOY4R_12760 [Pseudomonadota bacterium]
MGSIGENREARIAAMGEHLGLQYEALWQDLAYLHLVWLEFKELFGIKESRVVLLNHAAGLFFRIVQDQLWEAVILQIAKLTDAPRSNGKSNLSIQSIPKLVGDATFRREINGLCERALNASSFAKDLRNRHIAHRDLDLLLRNDAKPLPEVSRLQVAAALDALTAVMNALSRHYMQSDTSFEHVDRFRGAKHLLRVLNDGVAAEKARQERFLDGDFSALNDPGGDL